MKASYIGSAQFSLGSKTFESDLLISAPTGKVLTLKLSSNENKFSGIANFNSETHEWELENNIFFELNNIDENFLSVLVSNMLKHYEARLEILAKCCPQ